MLSQADILKTLINKSCTDDAVMATALSPDCTPPRLLERLTEAERFDVALDISMKLGLDVIPLWRTWALRALRHANFATARDKFRHCFQRFRLPGRSNSSQQSQLLTSILQELCRMPDTRANLQEEIERIKRRRLAGATSPTHEEKKTTQELRVIDKPAVYKECLYYLDSYGTARDHVRFYARNFLWHEAAKYLLQVSSEQQQQQQQQLMQFFIDEVFQFASANGQLDRLLEAFKEQLEPPSQWDNQWSAYFKAMCEFCTNHRKFHLLYYLQQWAGLHLEAAYTQIRHIFLRRPVHSYRELNGRLASLLEARKNCQDFLDSAAAATDKCPQLVSNQTLLSALGVTRASGKAAVETLIKTIERQVEITRNFAANEVGGCLSGIEFGGGGLSECEPPGTNNEDDDDAAAEEENNDTPVSLFDSGRRRKTFFGALVLTYFDLSCTTYFSRNGLDLAGQLMEDYRLDELSVFKLAMQVLMRDEGCDIFRNAQLLLDRIREHYAARNAALELAAKSKPTPRPPAAAAPVASGSRSNRGSVVAQARTAPAPAQHRLSLPARVRAPAAGLPKTPPPPPPAAAKVELRSSAAPRPRTMSDAAIGALCDQVILDAIRCCREPDYKMELAKLLSGEAQIEFYVESGKLSNAQRLACNLNRPDYVARIIREAGRLNQEHVKTVCQLWLAKHETRNLLR